MTDARARTLIYRLHASKRMLQRGISSVAVEQVITHGEIIETYPDDTPFESRLLLGFPDSRALHVVVADEPGTERTYIITAYEPAPGQWSADFRRRVP